MKQGFFCVVLFLIMATSAGCANSKVNIAAEVEAIQARSQEIVAAEAEQDIDKALSFYTKNAIVQPAGVPQAQGSEAIAELYRQFFKDNQIKESSVTSSEVTVSKSGDLAYEYGRSQIVLAGPESDLQDIGKYLTIWQKIDGEWFIAAGSFSSDSPAPKAVSNE